MSVVVCCTNCGRLIEVSKEPRRVNITIHNYSLTEVLSWISDFAETGNLWNRRPEIHVTTDPNTANFNGRIEADENLLCKECKADGFPG